MNDLIKKLEKYRENKGFTQEELAAKINVSTRTYQSIVKSGEVKRVDILENINKLLNRQNISRETMSSEIDENESYLEQRRNKKNADNPYLVPFVDIPAQAGYTKAYDQIDYIQTLKKFPILPDVDPHGAIWRYFQVEGDSMENPHAKQGEDEGIKSGDTLLTSQILKEDWGDIKKFYTYVVVTETDLWIKDVFPENKNEWILISRNESYKPFIVKVEDVKQLWVMRRHIRNRARKSRMYNIDEIRRQIKKSA